MQIQVEKSCISKEQELPNYRWKLSQARNYTSMFF